MKRLFKLAHYIGFTFFLGSIFTFLVVSTLTRDGTPADLLFARRVISAGTFTLTLPGLWLVAISGIAMMLREYGFMKNGWLNVKTAAILLMIISSHFIIVPAMTEALELAQAAVLSGSLSPDYASAYMRESVFGGINVLLALGSMVLGVWNSNGKKKERLAF